MRIDVDGPLHAEWMSGRKALVTGGGGRSEGPGTVGWAIARLLARHGAAVAVLDRDPVAAERTVSQIQRAGGTASAVIADVSDDEDCQRAVTEAATVLGVPAGTVKSRAFYALRALKLALEERGLAP